MANVQIPLSEMMKKWEFKYLTPNLDPNDIHLIVPDINRPALQLAGYFNHFDHSRVQIVGNVEYHYLEELGEEEQLRRYEALFKANSPYTIPVMVFCRGLRPSDKVCELAEECGCALLATNLSTGEFMAEVVIWLQYKFAPVMRTHGVLVDVFGVGVLITGDSGIGKSEAALELVKRGHRLVSDDAVDIRRIDNDTLKGSAPSIIKNMIELRGVGIIDVRRLYGVGAIADECRIDMVIHLEEWDKEKGYDRLGTSGRYREYLGVKIDRYDLPLRPGRNLAIIVETAAMNHRQKEQGYSADKVIQDRMSGQFGAAGN